MPEDHPTTLRGDNSFRLLRMSLKQRKLCVRHYAKLMSTKAAQPPTGFPLPDQLSYDTDLFFKGLDPLPDNIRTY